MCRKCECMNNCPIGILDSGIGGVTVLKEIIEMLPHENYIYYSDSLHNPYGEKTKDEVVQYVDSIVQFFLSKKCKAIVMACNTATALSVQEMRNKYRDIIIIGIEPAYKMIHDFSYYKKTLVMATPATIRSEKFLCLYHMYDNKNTILLSCDKLAYLIESEDNVGIQEYLWNILPREDIEAVVLGCTHYPLVKKQIQKVLGPVIFYDGGSGVAHQLYNILTTKNLLSNMNTGNIEFIDSSLSFKKKERFFDILNYSM